MFAAVEPVLGIHWAYPQPQIYVEFMGRWFRWAGDVCVLPSMSVGSLIS